MGKERTITDQQMKLLADIFRVILKEITCDEDKLRLAPGELGIDWKEECLYAKNPHTGELMSPNSISHLNQILSKYDKATNLLNADRISGIRLYSDLSQLTPLGVSLSVDSAIRQMEYPSIMYAPVKYFNYESLGYPSDDGILSVIKISPEAVTLSFYDNRTYQQYAGQYNPYKNQFEGWCMTTGVESDFTETSGGGDLANIELKEPITDMMILTIRVKETLNPGAKVSINGEDPLPIINADGSELATSIAANNIIMLIYDGYRKSWIIQSTTQSTTSVALSVMNDRIDTFTTDMTNRVNKLSDDFTREVNGLKSRPGNIITYSSVFTANADEINVIPHQQIEHFEPVLDKLVINYNQTILRESIDYEVDEVGDIHLLRFKLKKDDVLQFIVIKQAATTQQEP